MKKRIIRIVFSAGFLAAMAFLLGAPHKGGRLLV